MIKTIFTLFDVFDNIRPIVFLNALFGANQDQIFLIVMGKFMSAIMQDIEQVHEVLSQHIVGTVKKYLSNASSKDSNLNLYQLIVEEVEAPLFRTVMEMTRYNQSKAARVLGVSRGTLRTKLKRYFDDEFIGTREID